MATQADLDAQITNLETNEATLIQALTGLIQAQSDAFNRFLAKLAGTGIVTVDLQPEIDRINAVNQKIADATSQIATAKATADAQGV